MFGSKFKGARIERNKRRKKKEGKVELFSKLKGLVKFIRNYTQKNFPPFS